MTATIEKIASDLYTTYCKEVGGKSYNGDDLPTWEELAARTGEKEMKVTAAWRRVAHVAIFGKGQ